VAGFPGSGNHKQSSHAFILFKKKKKSCTADSRALSVIYTVCIFKTGHFCNWLLAPNAHMAPGKELYKLRVMEILAKEMK
jgi:hypothetical protein